MSDYSTTFHKGRKYTTYIPNIKKRIGDDEWKRYKLGDFIITKKPYHNNRYDLNTEWHFDPVAHEQPCCSLFGCGRTLSLREQLFGSRCIHHPPT